MSFYAHSWKISEFIEETLKWMSFNIWMVYCLYDKVQKDAKGLSKFWNLSQFYRMVKKAFANLNLYRNSIAAMLNLVEADLYAFVFNFSSIIYVFLLFLNTLNDVAIYAIEMIRLLLSSFSFSHEGKTTFKNFVLKMCLCVCVSICHYYLGLSSYSPLI